MDTEEKRLVGIGKMMAEVWPDEDERPSERFVRKHMSLKNIPFVKLGARVWFDPQQVRQVITAKTVPGRVRIKLISKRV